MSEPIPEAIIAPKSRFSVVWLIPLVALLIGGWLTFKYLYEKGTVIKIEFSSANGLAAGKTKIKHKDVVIGVVDNIAFSPGLEQVVVTATIDREMREHLTRETRFWVVRARVAAGEISGLGTLLSGAYIGMEPGIGNKLNKSFKGLDKPPALLTGDHGSRYRLSAETLQSFEAGAPIYYRRLKVGEVIDYKLDDQGEKFAVEIFIRTPYDQLVYDRSLFWNASGVDVKIGADGFEMRTESIIALLQGGLAFDNLDAENGSPALADTEFKLYESKDAATNIDYKRSEQQYRLYFDGSARGLSVGAPVTLRGITFGQVIDVKLQYDLHDKSFKIPVTIEFEPARLNIIGPDMPGTALPSPQDLIDFGLRAQLRSGNLLTGQMLIDFDVYPNAEPVEVRHEGEFIVLPTVPTPLDSIKNNLADIVEKIARMPIDDIGVNLNKTLEGTNTLIHSEDIKDIISNVNKSSKQLNSTLEGANTLIHSNDVKEALFNINRATAQLTTTLARTEKVAAGFGADSEAYQELLRTMRELSGATRSLRQMTEYLERHPEALLKGKPR